MTNLHKADIIAVISMYLLKCSAETFEEGEGMIEKFNYNTRDQSLGENLI